MGFIDILRMLGALALVLGLLVLAVPLLRKYGHRLPGLGSRALEDKQLALVERMTLDAGAKRQLLLVRAGAREHLILIAPEGVAMTPNFTPPAGDVVGEPALATPRTARLIDPRPSRQYSHVFDGGIQCLRRNSDNRG